MKQKIIPTITILFLLGACSPAQPPAARAPTALEEQLSNATDLSPLNTEFGAGIGNLTWLDESAVQNTSLENSWLRVWNTSRGNVWFSDTSGSLLYAYVTGNFMVETKIKSNLRNNQKARSTSRYTSAGLLLRDPASSPGKMRWIAFNIGSQDGFFGTELKTTRDSAGFSLEGLLGNSSLSTWFSNKIEGSSNEYHLRICRLGAEIRFYSKAVNTSDWQEETISANTVKAGSEAPVAGADGNGAIRLQRPDLPTTMQVGIMTNDIELAGTSENRFQQIRFARLNNFFMCDK